MGGSALQLGNLTLMLNEDALSCWLGRDNVGYTMIKGNRMLVLLDMGTNVNMITPGVHSSPRVTGRSTHRLV